MLTLCAAHPHVLPQVPPLYHRQREDGHQLLQGRPESP